MSERKSFSAILASSSHFVEEESDPGKSDHLFRAVKVETEPCLSSYSVLLPMVTLPTFFACFCPKLFLPGLPCWMGSHY